MNKWKVGQPAFRTICCEDSMCFVIWISSIPYQPNSNLYFQPLRTDAPIAVRQVKGVHLGRLITVRGIITRVSEVKPLLQVNA